MGIPIYRPQVDVSFYDFEYYGDREFNSSVSQLVASDRLNELSRVLNNGISRILDIGSGPADLDKLLIRDYPHCQIYTTDISYDLLRILKEKGANNHTLADACNLPFRKESFDLVILSEIIEHVSNPHLIIEEAHRVLSENGHLYVSTPNKYSLASIKGRDYFLDKDKSHTFVPSKSDVKNLLSGYFDIVRHTTLLFDFLKKDRLRELFGPIYIPHFGLSQRVIAVKKLIPLEKMES